MEDSVFSFPKPSARAVLHGDPVHPALAGEVLFSAYGRGSLILLRVVGMGKPGFFGFHVHEKGVCAPDGDVPFASAGKHYDPHNVPHPWHSGDLPPVLASSDGTAMMVIYTDRFRPTEVIGRSVLIHEMPDDLHSQPAGDSGPRMACGVIRAI